jgi:hypothetical protein
VKYGSEKVGVPDATSRRWTDSWTVARDKFIKLNRCYFCGQPGFVVWDVDLFSCGREVCESLAFAEVRRRNRNGRPMPEKQLAKALLTSLDTIEYALHLDRDAEVLEESKMRQMDELEREGTAHVLAELHKLERRWPAAKRLTGVSKP